MTLFLLLYIDIHNLPDPEINEDGHYRSFDEVFGSSTSEKDLPSAATNVKRNTKSLPFSATQQHVKNVNLVIQCDECDMWRLLFSKLKLRPQSLERLKSVLEDISYTCGSTFEDIEMPDDLQTVCVRVHKCFDHVEKLYYSCGFPEIICIYCCQVLPAPQATSSAEMETTYYPQCSDCSTKLPIKKVQRSRK